MDPKKQNLTPELKQIYDRVMNTQVGPKTGAQPAAPVTPIAPPPATTQPTPPPVEIPGSQPSTTPPPVAMPPIPGANNPTPSVPTTPTPTAPAAPAQTPAPGTSPTAPAPGGTTPGGGANGNQGFLSSVPPRPISDSKAFVFTGNKVQGAQKNDKAPAKESHKSTGAGEGKKISMPIIGALVVVLVVVWGVFWAKLLGFF